MLSKEDYQTHIEAMKCLEHTMHDIYSQTALRLEDEEIKKVLLQISQEETAHEQLVSEIRKLVLG